MKKLFLVAMTAMVIVSCNDGADTTVTTKDSAGMTSADNDLCAKQERNKQIALAGVSGFADKNIDIVMKDADSNFVEYGDGSFPPVKGLDSSRLMLQSWMAAVPDYRGENFIAAADGNKVLVYGDWMGTWTGDFMGMKATGKKFKVADVDIFTFNDAGKIIDHRTVQSSATLAAQIGMGMPPAENK
jgi:predicted ester cyclase